MMKLIQTAVFVLTIIVTSALSQAATLTVQNLNDSGPGSLRQTIADSNPGDTIEFAPGIAGGTINLESEIPIVGSLEILGPKPEKLTLDGQDQTRIFNISGVDTDTIIMSALVLQNGFADQDDGGAILINGPNLEINHCVFDSNRTFCNSQGCDAEGGALRNREGNIEIVINYSSFINNSTQCIGDDCTSEGGVYHNGGGQTNTTFNKSAFISNSTTCTGEDCDSGGGAFHNGGGGISNDQLIIIVHNTTFALNTTHCSGFDCNAEGGAIDNAGGEVFVDISNSTFDQNTSSCEGEECAAFINILDGVEEGTIKNNIFYSDAAGANCDNEIQMISEGYNIDNGSSCIDGSVAGDKPNTNPRLDPRGPRDNGGPTPTVALFITSPAIDMGSPDCPPPDTDQRGFPRPEGVACDIGAFEGSVQELRSVPTLNEWGLIVMASVLGLIGFMVIRRRAVRIN
ncbi:MAG: IPTL-CTERM sorting domain-containing protein [Thermodesulfobacteriota bacterium]